MRGSYVRLWFIRDRHLRQKHRGCSRVIGSGAEPIEEEIPKWWERGRDISKLVSIYGRRAAIVGSAKRVELRRMGYTRGN